MKHRNTYRFALFSRVIAVLIVLVSFAGTDLLAQNTTGTIRGTITGDNGLPISSVQIVARNTSTGVTRNAITNDAGAYTLVGLVPGTYDVNVRRIGSAPQTRTIVV